MHVVELVAANTVNAMPDAGTNAVADAVSTKLVPLTVPMSARHEVE